MSYKHVLYRVLFPFRSAKQIELKKMRPDLKHFLSELGLPREREQIGIDLWNRLVDLSFVPQFRPSPDDNLHQIYALGPDEVWEELFLPLVGLSKKDSISDRTRTEFLNNVRSVKDLAYFISATS